MDAPMTMRQHAKIVRLFERTDRPLADIIRVVMMEPERPDPGPEPECGADGSAYGLPAARCVKPRGHDGVHIGAGGSRWPRVEFVPRHPAPCNVVWGPANFHQCALDAGHYGEHTAGDGYHWKAS